MPKGLAPTLKREGSLAPISASAKAGVKHAANSKRYNKTFLNIYSLAPHLKGNYFKITILALPSDFITPPSFTTTWAIYTPLGKLSPKLVNPSQITAL
jgi:hypothetical protein